jgi:anaerobic selenocysteine-containing dehydrogenase
MHQNIDRRAFLKASATSLAALALAPRGFAESLQVAPPVKPQRVTRIKCSCRLPVAEHWSRWKRIA